MIGKRKQTERLRWPREERAVRGVILIMALGEDDSAAGPCCASSPSPKGHVKWGDVSPGWARSDALVLGPVLWPKKLWPGRKRPTSGLPGNSFAELSGNPSLGPLHLLPLLPREPPALKLEGNQVPKESRTWVTAVWWMADSTCTDISLKWSALL